MQSRHLRLASWALATLTFSCGGTVAAQDGGPKQITGTNPPARQTIRLFLDPELKREHASKNIPAASAKWPRPVLEEAPSGAVRTLLDVGGSMAEVWLHPSEVKTGKAAEGNCLLAQRSVGPIGATRGANEGCGVKK